MRSWKRNIFDCADFSGELARADARQEQHERLFLKKDGQFHHILMGSAPTREERLREDLVHYVDRTIFFIHDLDESRWMEDMERLTELGAPSDGRDYFEQRTQGYSFRGVSDTWAAEHDGFANDIVGHHPKMLPGLLASLSKLLHEKLQEQDLFEGADLSGELAQYERKQANWRKVHPGIWR